MRALFVNQAAGGRGVMGHAAIETAIRAGLPAADDVTADFVSLGPFGPLGRNLTRRVPGLYERELDLQVSRWHVAQGLRTRAVNRDLGGGFDALHVNSHAIGLLLPFDRPTFLSLDATIWDWRYMDAAPRSYSRAALGPSLTLERRALTRATRVLAWTEWAAEHAATAAPGARIDVHHPGLDLERFSASAPERDGPVRILFVGGRFEAKGGPDLLAAAAPLIADGRAELDIVTQSQPAVPGGVRLHRLGPDDPELLDLYRRADVFCLPTSSDTFGFAFLEAMACRTAVIGGAVGGVPDVLGDAGAVVEPGDRNALTQELRDLVEDRDRRTQLAAAARERVEAHFDARVQVPKLVELMRAAS